MKERLQVLGAWIARDWKRFVWEVISVAFFSVVSWGVTYWLNQGAVRNCEKETEAMVAQWNLQQIEMDQLQYEGLIAERDQIISQQDGRINELQAKLASDSIAHLSDLQAVRAINQYVKKGGH